MTEEDFLTRWSRRKRSSAEGEKNAPESLPVRAEASPNSADKIIANVERSISDDGQTMTITFKGTVPNGDVVDNLSIYTKVQPRTGR